MLPVAKKRVVPCVQVQSIRRQPWMPAKIKLLVPQLLKFWIFEFPSSIVHIGALQERSPVPIHLPVHYLVRVEHLSYVNDVALRYEYRLPVPASRPKISLPKRFILLIHYFCMPERNKKRQMESVIPLLIVPCHYKANQQTTVPQVRAMLQQCATG